MFTLNCKGQLFTWELPVVMGIVNLTPDSFYSGSRTDRDHLLSVAEKMIAEGAAFLDIGGQSTRPNSQLISEEEELKRVIPAIERLARTFPDQLISVDTFYSRVARESIEAGAHLINDISAGTMDDQLLPVVATLKVPYVLMHMRGTPQTMQQLRHYNNVSLDVFDELKIKLAELTRMGLNDIIIDPGFGFAKTIQHNFQLLAHLPLFKQLNRPVLAGLSRKATVYRTLSITPEDALNGTTVLNTLAIKNGASILRVHDVKEAVQVIKLYEVYKKEKQV